MKNQDTFTLWGVQDKATSAVFRVYLTRKEARRYGVSRYHKPVKLECRIVEQRPKKPSPASRNGTASPTPACARLQEWHGLTDAGLRLRCGEMTAQEIRTVRAVLNNIKGE